MWRKYCSFLLCCFVMSASLVADDVRLPLMLQIDWKKGPSLPRGFQDSQGDLIGNHLISVGGFCSGQKDVPNKPNTYPRGFMKTVYALNLKQPNSNWKRFPGFPGAARQGMQAIAVESKLYCWGGFSYEEPYCYQDGYILKQTEKGWEWTELPDIPWPITAAGICAVGTHIYIHGGAQYDLTKFLTANGPNGDISQLGSRLIRFDTNHPERGWQELARCPGTPRWVHAMAAINDKIYVLGGATGSDNKQKATFTVVDNWQYNPDKNRWQQLADLPVASGNFPSGAIVYANRYILLVGGYQYGAILNPDGTTRPTYGQPTRRYADNAMASDVFVYDSIEAKFGRATPLPLNNNLPMTVLRGETLHLVGGEIQSAVIEDEHFGHHPDLYLTGTIQVAN